VAVTVSKRLWFWLWKQEQDEAHDENSVHVAHIVLCFVALGVCVVQRRMSGDWKLRPLQLCGDGIHTMMLFVIRQFLSFTAARTLLHPHGQATRGLVP
jgi:hypothetical protein